MPAVPEVFAILKGQSMVLKKLLQMQKDLAGEVREQSHFLMKIYMLVREGHMSRGRR